MRACVCDGMGGESYGEVASEIAANTLLKYCSKGMSRSQLEMFADINSRICEEIASRRVRHMGSTMVHLHIEDDTATVCSIGDSRAYLFSKGILMRLTTDHRTRDPYTGRTFLTQNLGIEPEEFIIEPELSETIPLEPGMIFILCSDGLTDMVTDNELQMLMDTEHSSSAEDIAQALIDKALQNGGRDNITVIVLKIS